MKRILCIGILLTTTALWAETDHTEETTGKAETSKAGSEKVRPAQNETTLKPQETRLLSTIFRIPTGVVSDLYGGKQVETSIPRAVDAALSGDETKLAKVVADLYGTLNKEQLSTAMGVVENERTTELAKTPRDARYSALLDRLFWGGKILQGEPATSEGSQKYNAAFDSAFKDRQARIELIKTKVKEALDGNNEAKKFLKEALNRRTIMAFIDAQMKSGNKKDALDLVQALSDGKANKSLDLFSGNETHRLNLGATRESMEKALQAYGDAKGGLHTTTLAAKPFVAPSSTFTLSTDGQLGAAQPKAGTVAANDSRSKVSDSKSTPVRSSTNPDPTNGGAPRSGATPTGGGLAAFLSGNCIGCHSQGDPEATSDGRIKKGSKLLAVSDAVTAMSRVPAMRTGVPPGVKAQLAAFAR